MTIKNEETLRVSTPRSRSAKSFRGADGISDVLTTNSKLQGHVMVLDKCNKLKKVEYDHELKKYQNDLPENGPVKSKEVARALDNFADKRIDQINHFTDVGQYMKDLRDREQICDVKIKVGSQLFSSHRTALSRQSNYFHNLFSDKTKKMTKLPTLVKIRNCSSEAFTLFLDFVYTGEINLCPDNLAEIVSVADSLKASELKERCFRCIDNMNLENVLKVVEMKKLSSKSDVFQFAAARIAQDFSNVSKYKSFYEMDARKLCLIISRDDLITTEMDVFRLSFKWLAYKMVARQRHAYRVMRCINYQKMGQTELLECLEVASLIPKSRKIKNLILRSYQKIKAEMENKPVVESPMNAKRKRRNSVDLFAHSLPGEEVNIDNKKPDNAARTGDILAMGWFQQDQTSDIREGKSVERYNTTKNQWTHDGDLPERRFYYSAALLKGKVYLVGGYALKNDRRMPVATNEAFILNDGKWTPIAPLNTPRMHHTVVSLYGMLYAVGGEDEKGRVLNTVECYNPTINQWFYVKPMSTARLGAGVAVCDGKIVVAGGCSESSWRNPSKSILSSVEAFDPKCNSWKAEGSLRFPRCHANLVNVQGTLCLCGGATKSFTPGPTKFKSVSTIDVYNKEKGVWEYKSNMVTDRHFAGSVVIGGKIYIMGGMSTVEKRVLSSVECYDPIKDVWINGVKDLPHPARWLNCIPIP